jgi:rare lipoprotein A (peptidoglycan hydrolase)
MNSAIVTAYNSINSPIKNLAKNKSNNKLATRSQINLIFSFCIYLGIFVSINFASFSSHAHNHSQPAISTELLDAEAQDEASLSIEIIQDSDDLLNWVDSLESLEEPGQGASNFELELYEYLIDYRSKASIYLSHVRAYKRTCSALDSESARQGVASWYGPGFHGRTTANGERFNQNELTAAHKTIPFNSIVEVTYRGRTVRVRINDAGPYHGNRIIDLSKEAASQLGILGAGTGTVTLTLIICGQS